MNALMGLAAPLWQKHFGDLLQWKQRSFLSSRFWAHCPLCTLLVLLDRPTARRAGKGNETKGAKGKGPVRWKSVQDLPKSRAEWTETDHMVARRARQQKQQQQKQQQKPQKKRKVPE
jgi:hypothetical protein